MASVQITLLGIDVAHPASVATNLILTAECLWIARRVHRTRRASRWTGFFLALAVGAGFGAIKHGFPSLPGELWAAVRFTSNVGLIVAVTYAQLALLQARPEWADWRPLLTGCVLAQLTFFVGWSLRTQDFLVPGLALALGMGPVLAAETVAALKGREASRWVAAGLAIALSGGAIYALEVAPSPWFNHVDVAHLILGATVVLVFQGVRVAPPSAGIGRESWS